MAKYLSGRVERTSQSELTDDRYDYLGLNQTEPNLGDPTSVYPSLPIGQQYQIISILGYPGERYWIPVGGGLIPGSISIFDQGSLVGTLNSITQLNFVGNSVTADAVPFGIGATITVTPPGNNGSVLFKESGDFATSSGLLFNSSVGILTVGNGLVVGVGGTFFNVNTNGLVGIGTTNPTSNLYVEGDAKFTGVVTTSNLYVTGISTLIGKIVSGNGIGNTNLSNTLDYSSSSGITAFRPISLVDSAAGIKISRNAGQSSGAAIELQTWDVGIVTNYSYWDVNAENGYFGIRDRKNAFTRIFIDDTGSILLGANSATFSNNYNQLVGIGTDKLLNVLGNSYISGSVGIGTTNPTQKLHIQGDLRLTGTIYDYNNQPGTNTQILVKNNFGGLTWIDQGTIQAGAGGTYRNIQFHNNAGLVDGAPNFVFDEINSRVGIGSTQPRVLLDVLGISSFRGGTFINNFTVTGVATIQQLNVSGVSTFNSQLNINNLNVTGVGTFDNIKLDTNTISTGTGNLILDSSAGTTQVNDALYINDTTESTSKDTGSIITEGGVGIEKNLYVNGTIYGNVFGAIIGYASSTAVSVDSTNTNRYVPFVDITSGISTVRTDNLFVWNPSNNFLGIGTTNPTKSLHVYTADGDIRLGDITEGTSSTDAGVIFTGLGSNTSAMFTEVDGTILSYGINCAQIVGIETPRAGGIFRLDTRTSGTYGDASCFVVKGRPIGTTAEYNAIVVGLNDGNTYLSPVRGNVLVGAATSTGTASQPLQVTGGAYVSGNLGIGNTNPGAKLDVLGDIRLSASDAEIEFNTGGARLKGRSNALSIHTGGGLNSDASEQVRINTTGVGIGTTNPGATLHVTPTSTSIAGLFSGTTSSDMVRITQLGSGNALVVEDESNPDATPFVITALGNVGVGTTPVSNLDIDGPIISRSGAFVISSLTASTWTNPVTATNVDHIWHNDGGVGVGVTWGLGGIWNFVSDSSYKAEGNSWIRAGGFANITPTLGASYPLQISGNSYISGNLGIGTTNPSQSLHVQGSSRVTGARYDSSNSAGTSGQILQSTGTGTQWTTQGILNVAYADRAGIATNVIGGIASVTQLNVTGVSTFNGNVTLGDANTDKVSFGATVDSNIIPSGTTRDLGSATNKWNNVYANSFNGTFVGVADSAARLSTARNIAITGDLSWNVNFDGSANVTSTGTLANSGVTAGTYGSSTTVGIMTVDAKGRITAASNIGINFSTATVAQSDTVKTQSSSTNASFYPTFVDSDNAIAGYESVYTDAGISYNPATNLLSLTNLTVSGISTFNGNVIFGDATTDTVSFTSRVGTGITPSTNGTLNLGGTSNKWNNVYANSFVGAITGNADTATRLATPRNIDIDGDVTGVGIGTTFDGSQNVTIQTILSNSGVTAGTYGSSTTVGIMTVDAKGRITAASNVAINFGAASVGQADKVATISTATNASFYPTFVDANNVSSTYESVYTDAGISYNPSTDALTAGSFVKTGGTSSQFLKADGSVDSGIYITSPFPAGTTLVFYQAAAPVGWAQSTTHNNKAMRVVSGTGGGSGGTSAFTSVFASRTPTGTVSVSGSNSGGSIANATVTGSVSGSNSGGAVSNHTLTTSQMPFHQHGLSMIAPDVGGGDVVLRYSGGYTNTRLATDSAGGSTVHGHGFTNPSWSGSISLNAHSHTFTNPTWSGSASFSGAALDFAVQYIDVILCYKT